MKSWIVYSDGACWPNPGEMAIGAVVIDPTGKMRATISRRVGRGTNNEAELLAAVAGLEEAIRLGAPTVELRTDSALVVGWLTRGWKAKREALRILVTRARELVTAANTRVVHVPREQNTVADALADGALRETGVSPPWWATDRDPTGGNGTANQGQAIQASPSRAA